MKSLFRPWFLLFSTLALQAAPDGLETLEPGASAPDFSLPGVDGRNHTLADYDEADILAILFTCNHCPSAQGAESRIKDLIERYRDRSFQLVAISPNADRAVRINELGYSVYGDSLEDMKKHARDQGFDFPYLYDGETQAASLAYGVVATPQIFVFDRDRILRYVGRIDDSKFGDPATIQSHDARNAIDALFAGKPVPKAKTRAHGCSTKWSDKIEAVEKFEADFAAKEVTLEAIDAAELKKLAANRTEKLRLFNLWATWCGPCVAELPSLVQIGRQFETRGFDMITISTDEPGRADDVLRILRESNAALPDRTEKSVKAEGRSTNNYLFKGDTDTLAEALDPEWQGPLPYTLLVDPGGKIIFRQTGEIDPDHLRRKIVSHLGRWYSPK